MISGSPHVPIRSALPLPLRTLCLPAVLAALASLGCVDHNSKAPLYVFDAGTTSVQEWDDVNAVYSATGSVSAAANRTITSSVLANNLAKPLAWGGLALDTSANRLYLVSEGGVVTVILKADSQSGAISGTDNVITFNLGAAGTDRYSSGSVFGQAAVDTSSHTLYVMETAQDGSACRIWNVANASSLPDQWTVPVAQTFFVTGDTFGSGVAAVPGGKVYGLFGGGNTITDNLAVTYSGVRLRQGTGSGFAGAASNVLIGPLTLLNTTSSAYGSLAYDAQNSQLYAFTAPASSPAQVLVFSPSQFSASSLNQAPTRILGDAAGTLANLRVLAHPPYSDWLLGADYTVSSGTTGTGLGLLRVWKDPSGGAVSATAITMTGTSQIRGMALGATD